MPHSSSLRSLVVAEPRSARVIGNQGSVQHLRQLTISLSDIENWDRSYVLGSIRRMLGRSLINIKITRANKPAAHSGQGFSQQKVGTVTLQLQAVRGLEMIQFSLPRRVPRF
jgi:hypothetical protein